MKAQQDTARNSWSGSGDEEAEAIWVEIKNRFKNIKFLGYEQFNTEAKVVAIIKEEKEIN